MGSIESARGGLWPLALAFLLPLAAGQAAAGEARACHDYRMRLEIFQHALRTTPAARLRRYGAALLRSVERSYSRCRAVERPRPQGEARRAARAAFVAQAGPRPDGLSPRP